MTVSATPRGAAGSATWADALLLSFGQAGYVRAEPAILQPAEPFLDLSGEDIRKSLYLTSDSSGEELCLRPDLTIPVARDYLASPRAGQPAGFSYLGPVFRHRGSQPSEFLQAGIESFGRQDRAAADAEMLALALEATAAFGLTDVEIRTGDVALFNALIDALDLYPVWHAYFRQRQPKTLIAWGRGDPLFLVEGAEAFRGDLPAAAVHYLDGGHFVLEEHAARVAELILRHFTPERAAG